MPRRHALASLLLLALLFGLPATWPADAGDLADEHRTGTVVSVQGAALVRPGGRRRWTPLGQDAVLLPGDLVKTQTRGAHALEIQVPGDGSLLMGPGAHVLLPEPGRLQILAGEMEVKGREGAAVQVVGPGEFALEVSGTAWLRVEKGGVTTLEKPPRWLEGYRASTGDEWMGSLLANVDGRNVPLAVGYHKVTADIRDQIARTTVEQSFVNTTDGRLEGVFYFPLPADASISGFGMWIGGELVEADVVEKARARQIYEDILRRKKDPGLLEWSGGNLFKARVFPIEPHSEKRVRVRYTQVLRLEGNTWRYRYALRSDLLRSKPLRQLDVQVNVLSTRSLTNVACPSHTTRITSTGHEARVEMSAEEYVPTRDLEIAVTLEPTAGLGAITHRRGDEGWFMLLLTPPEPEAGGWTRTLMPEGEPLDVVLLADTSGSMDQAARETQAAFVEALLALLGEKDRFRLATTDVDLTWAFEDARPATDEAVAQALAFLETRTSLGWTDLDGAIDKSLAAAGPQTLVIYVGDGIPTTGDADPAAQADRLRMRGTSTQATVHAVSASSTYEQPVLEALASIGGGSVRRADGDPAGAAYALLAEAARPMLKDVKVKIEGVPTARVYPETLPNLALGSQQVVLGRFLPKADAQSGTVVVTADLGGRAVRYETPLSVPARGADDAGNSFLPRLWARKHLDVLLQQGSSAAVQEEIVGFSSEYGILTPYTSLLVLESDEDRERYGVTRTVKMRDGEAFFAEGRDKVQLEMQRQQARLARAWRLGLRRQMLREIAGLGRDLVPDRPLAQVVAVADDLHDVGVDFRGLGGTTTAGVPVTRLRGDLGEKRFKGAWGRGRGDEPVPVLSEGFEPAIKDGEIADHVETDNDLPYEESLGSELGRAANQAFDGAPPGLREPSDATPPPPTSPALRPPSRKARRYQDAKPEASQADELLERTLGESLAKRPQHGSGGYYAVDKLVELETLAGRAGRHRPRPPARSSVEGVGFPGALPVFMPRPELPAPAWAPEVLAVLQTLDRREAVAALPGGLELLLTNTGVHAVRGDAQSVHAERVLAGSAGWFLRVDPYRSERYEAWADGTVRARVHAYRGLGRRRPFLADDAENVPASIGGLAFDAFEDVFRRYHVYIQGRQGDRVRLVIEGRELGRADRHLLIDAVRGTVVEERTVQDGRTTHRIRRSGYVEAGGLWWPRLTEVFDAYGRKTAFTTTQVKALDPEAFGAAFQSATTPADDVVFLDGDLPKPEAVAQAVHEERAAFVDYLLTALDHATKRQLGEAFEAWDAAQTLIGDVPGARWIHLVLLSEARRAVELQRSAINLARTGSSETPAEAAWWAKAIYEQVVASLGANERLSLLDILRDDWSAPADRACALSWFGARDHALRSAGRVAEARELRRDVANAWPNDLTALFQYVEDLRAVGEPKMAQNRLRAALDPRDAEVFTWEERNQLFAQLADLLWTWRDLPGLREVCRTWTERAPRSEDAWLHRASIAFLQGAVDETDAEVLSILRAEVPADPLSAERARLSAAVNLALGGGVYFSQRGIQEIYFPTLVDLGLRAARLDVPPANLPDRILSSYTFRRHDAARLLREGLRADLLAPDAIKTMAIRRLQRYGGLLSWSRRDVEDEVFVSAIAACRARFTTLEPGREKRALGDTMLRMWDAHEDPTEAAAFLGAWVASTRGFHASELAGRLFDRILRLDHTVEREEQAFALLPTLLHPHTPDAWSSTAATAARRLAKWAYAGRRKAAYGPPEDTAGLTRAEARARGKEASQTARSTLATRLAEARDGAGEAYGPWLEIERLGYVVEHGDALEALAAEARELLDGVAKTSKMPLDRVLAERAVLVLAYASTRRGSPEGLADAVLALLAEREADSTDGRLDWRYQIFRLLVALDRAPALETTLAGWIRPSEVKSAWRVVLAFLMAETGRLKEAATVLEAQAERDGLSPATWKTLATWYLVLGDDARREAALEGRMGAMTEGDLSNALYRARSRVQRRRGQVPGDLEVEDLRALRWVLRKASRPQNYIWQIRNIYDATKDHRVLEGVAAGLVGHTPEGVYAFLRDAASLVANIHEEATLDVAVEALEGLQKTFETSHDDRALALFEALLSGRAALVPKTDPAWLRRATEALKDVARGDFQTGERRLVAEVVVAGAPVKHAALAKARVALVLALHEAEPPDSPYRLPIAHALARILWAHGEHQVALERWEMALAKVRERTGVYLPDEARGVFDHYVDRLVERGHYPLAEAAIENAMDAESRVQVRISLLRRLHRLYGQALEGRGRLRIGQGRRLFEEAASRIDGWLEEGPASEAQNTVGAMVFVHQTAAKSHAIDGAGERLERWARDRMPRVFDRFILESTWLVRAAARGIHLQELRGPKFALLYAIDRLGDEPTFFARIGLDLWTAMHWDLARWRKDAGPIDEAYEKRLLPYVIRSLEERLSGGRRDGRGFWDPDYDRYWRAKSGDFAATAHRLVELQPENETLQRTSAAYLRELGRRKEAVGVLLAATARLNLDPGGEKLLATWLVEDKRFAEALPLLEALTARFEELGLRLQLSQTLYGLDRKADALAVLKQAEVWLREHEWWSDDNVVQLGTRALEQGEPEAANGWLEEAVRLRLAARGGRRTNDSTLGRTYGLLARARVALGRTDEAVDAASACVVAWGHNHRQRTQALEALQKVFSGASDLDAWVETYEGRVAESGLDAPLIRKTLATVLATQGRHAKAAHHLRAARELAPEDAEIHQELVRVYDALGRPKDAIEALLASLRMAPKNLEAAADLAARFERAGLATEARRARLNLVEPLPHEAAGHRRLAEMLEKQKETVEAEVQWRQVVRTDPLNPTGWIALARIQIELGRTDAARRTLDHVQKEIWESRFGDVKKKASDLMRRLPETGK